MIRKFVLTMVFLAVPGHVLAADEDLKQFIGYYQGEITVTTEGVVKQVTLKDKDSANLDALIISQIKKWEFYPVTINGNAVEATSPFDLQVIASFTTGNKISHITFRDVAIGKSEVELAINETKPVFSAAKGKRAAIHYPIDGAGKGYGAEMLVAIEIDASGRVKQADVYNVALTSSGHRTDKRARDYALNTFGQSALAAIRKWHWTPEEMAGFNCSTGCISTMSVQFRMDKAQNWSTYSDQKIELPAWAQQSNPNVQLDETKSRYVKLKTDPTNKDIAVGS
jgi:hypothetical protein